MGLAAGGDTLIRRHRRIAINKFDAAEPHRKFFSDQLSLRGGNTLPEFTLSRVGGHISIGGNRDPRIDLVQSRAPCHSSRKIVLASSSPIYSCHTEGDDQCSCSFQEEPAGKSSASQLRQR